MIYYLAGSCCEGYGLYYKSQEEVPEVESSY